MSRVIAALYVDPRGAYAGLPGVECWDEARDARTYSGPHPVVAHPPCARWCRLAGLVQARWGYQRGDDGGCFASALESVRRFGGVLEHPAYSDAWPAHQLLEPPRSGGWVYADWLGGWTCHVEQGRYGHLAKKATWLYAAHVDLPSLSWGSTPDSKIVATVSWCQDKFRPDRRRLRKHESIQTPEDFRDVLLSIARTAAPRTS